MKKTNVKFNDLQSYIYDFVLRKIFLLHNLLYNLLHLFKMRYIIIETSKRENYLHDYRLLANFL